MKVQRFPLLSGAAEPLAFSHLNSVARTRKLRSQSSLSNLLIPNVVYCAMQGRPASALDVEVPEGNGSGVIWDSEGNVVTNYHVLASSFAKLNMDKDPGTV